MERSFLLALPIAAGCCPNGGAAVGQENSIVATDLGAPIDDAGCATLCLGLAQKDFRITGNIDVCTANVVDAGLAMITCSFPVSTCAGGRRPAGFDSLAVSAHDAIGEWLARAAALEAASVAAFRILAAELHAHGAPRDLVTAAKVSAHQETHHAMLMARLARRFGAAAAHTALSARPVRSLLEISLENAVEGGVRETFGARIAAEQARTAFDAGVRLAFATIAPEEQQHADLSSRIADWTQTRLSARQNRQVRDVREIALQQLANDIESESAPEARSVLGLPDPNGLRDLLRSL